MVGPDGFHGILNLVNSIVNETHRGLADVYHVGERCLLYFSVKADREAGFGQQQFNLFLVHNYVASIYIIYYKNRAKTKKMPQIVTFLCPIQESNPPKNLF